MKGLLDFSDPQTMGLLGISSGLMQAGGPSRMPTSLGQGMSMGLNQGMQFAENASQMQNRSRALDQRDELMRLKSSAMGMPGQQQQFAPSSLGKLIEERNKLPPGSPLIAAYDSAIKNVSEGQERSPSYQFFPTPQGMVALDRRGGTASQVSIPGAPPIISPSADPALQRRLETEKAKGKELGGSQATSQIDLPRVIDNASNAMSLIDQMVGTDGPQGRGKPHPGFGAAVGLRVPGMTMVPGTEAANFQSLLDQVKGGAFLEAFNSLKGGGQITEVEGKKATDAITRMSNAQSERAFIQAAREYQDIIRKGVERAKIKAGVNPERRSEPRSGGRVVVDF